MDKNAKMKYLSGVASKYQKADRAGRSELLDEVVAKLKIHRKSAIRLLSQTMGGGSSKKSTAKKARKRKTKK